MIEGLNFNLVDTRDPAESLKEKYIPIIKKETQGIVTAVLSDYDGDVVTYSPGIGSTMAAIYSLSGREKIAPEAKDHLGADDNRTKYEFCLTAELLEDYRFGIMIIEYGIEGYPVTVAIEENIANEIQNGTLLYRCESMSQFEELCNAVLGTEYLRTIINGIIQACKRKEASNIQRGSGERMRIGSKRS